VIGLKMHGENMNLISLNSAPKV